jgi:SNF family Na+-dependent transporter
MVVEVLREDGSVWSTAVSQVFFSLSVTFGIMTAYGSYCPRGEPAYLNSCVVGLSDTLFSLISGFAVFAALGHLAYLESVPIEDLSYRGFSLVFGTWPVVLGQLPGGIHWVRLLFVDLFLLGIDSAFSFIEGFSTVFLDTVYFQNTPRWKLAGSLCILGWLLSLMYATDAGLVWLDVIDFYINYTMILVGFFESKCHACTDSAL